MDADIYINFLIIIDLGVFFILLGFLLNFVSLFDVSHLSRGRGGFAVLLLFIFYLLVLGGRTSAVSSFFPFLVLFYDWFAIFNLFYFTDLQLLSDIYFTFSGFEFILMNFYLYTVIFCLYILRRSSYAFVESGRSPSYFRGSLTVRGNFMRVQDPQAQVLVRASVRT